MQWPFYVYIHRRPDTGDPFYVGKGTSEVPGMYHRAHSAQRRSKGWLRVAAKGCLVDVFACCRTEADALRLEAETIRALSREHPLVNCFRNTRTGTIFDLEALRKEYVVVCEQERLQVPEPPKTDRPFRRGRPCKVWPSEVETLARRKRNLSRLITLLSRQLRD